VNISPEEMALHYWQRMRRASLKEIEARMAQLKGGSPQTLRYWLQVHTILEKKAALTERKPVIKPLPAPVAG